MSRHLPPCDKKRHLEEELNRFESEINAPLVPHISHLKSQDYPNRPRDYPRGLHDYPQRPKDYPQQQYDYQYRPHDYPQRPHDYPQRRHNYPQQPQDNPHRHHEHPRRTSDAADRSQKSPKLPHRVEKKSPKKQRTVNVPEGPVKAPNKLANAPKVQKSASLEPPTRTQNTQPSSESAFDKKPYEHAIYKFSPKFCIDLMNTHLPYPVVGLTFCLEINFGPKSSMFQKYICICCSVSLEAEDMLQHIQSIQHMKNYMRKMMPFTFLKFKYLSKTNQTDLDEFLELIKEEQFEKGRGRVGCVTEKDQTSAIEFIKSLTIDEVQEINDFYRFQKELGRSINRCERKEDHEIKTQLYKAVNANFSSNYHFKPKNTIKISNIPLTATVKSILALIPKKQNKNITGILFAKGKLEVFISFVDEESAKNVAEAIILNPPLVGQYFVVDILTNSQYLEFSNTVAILTFTQLSVFEYEKLFTNGGISGITTQKKYALINFHTPLLAEYAIERAKGLNGAFSKHHRIINLHNYSQPDNDLIPIDVIKMSKLPAEFDRPEFSKLFKDVYGIPKFDLYNTDDVICVDIFTTNKVGVIETIDSSSFSEQIDINIIKQKISRLNMSKIWSKSLQVIFNPKNENQLRSELKAFKVNIDLVSDTEEIINFKNICDALSFRDKINNLKVDLIINYHHTNSSEYLDANKEDICSILKRCKNIA